MRDDASQAQLVQCPQCGRHYRIPSETLGKMATCRNCQARFLLACSPSPTTPPSGQATSGPTPETDRLCAICQCAIGPSDAATNCPDCHAPYHSTCWEYNRGCGIYGCPQTPPTEKITAMETPMSFWGKEQKTCPACNREIQAAAIRCRYCGAAFPSSQPEDAEGFRARTTAVGKAAKVGRETIWLLVFSIVPCTAPLAAVIGPIWYFRHRQEVRQLPVLRAALCKLALCVAIGQSAFGLMVAVFHSAIR